MSGKAIPMQEFLLEHDQVYRENYAATLRNNRNGLTDVQLVLRWQFNAAKRRLKQAGLLDENWRPRR